MDVSYIGKKPIDWDPRKDKLNSRSSKVENEKKQFVGFVEDHLKRLQKGKDKDDPYADDVKIANEKRLCVALRAIALDPETDFGEMTFNGLLNSSRPLDERLEVLYELLTRRIDDISETWAGTREDLDNEGVETEAVRRRRLVPRWYGDMCLLTGDERPHGAHIVPARVTRNKERALQVWKMLRCFWPLPQLDELEVRGFEASNSLPLCPNMHAKFDRYEFALRPVADPENGRRIYIQLVWLDNMDTPDGDHARARAVDLRRCANGLCPLLQHGDVFAISTPDAENFPLPSMRLLQIQYGVHKIMAGMRAASSLRVIFGANPPDDKGPVPYRVAVPEMWVELLDAAVAADVLDAAAAERWGRAFTWDLVRKMKQYDLPLPELAQTQEQDAGGRANGLNGQHGY